MERTIFFQFALCRVRIPKEQVFYYRCPDHGQKFVLSISFAFDQEDDVYQVKEGLRILNSCRNNCLNFHSVIQLLIFSLPTITLILIGTCKDS